MRKWEEKRAVEKEGQGRWKWKDEKLWGTKRKGKEIRKIKIWRTRGDMEMGKTIKSSLPDWMGKKRKI